MRLDEYQIANALIDTRLVMTSRLVWIDRRKSRITSNPELISERSSKPQNGSARKLLVSILFMIGRGDRI